MYGGVGIIWKQAVMAYFIRMEGLSKTSVTSRCSGRDSNPVSYEWKSDALQCASP